MTIVQAAFLCTVGRQPAGGAGVMEVEEISRMGVLISYRLEGCTGG